MYPPVRQLDSHDLYRALAEPDRRRRAAPADLPRTQRAWLVATALLVAGLVAGAWAMAASV